MKDIDPISENNGEPRIADKMFKELTSETRHKILYEINKMT